MTSLSPSWWRSPVFFLLAASLALAAGCNRGRRPVALVTDPDVPEYGVVDRLGGDLLHVGEILETREHLAAIRYQDTSVEWVEEDRVQPLSALVGQQVVVTWGEANGDETSNEVTEVRRDLVQIAVGDEGHTWIPAALVVRVAAETDQQAEPEDGDAQNDQAEGVALGAPVELLEPITQDTPPQGALPQPADPSTIQDGSFVEVIYNSQRFPAEVVERGDEQVQVRWLPQNTQEWVPARTIVRVFEPIPDRQVTVGARVWYVGVSGLGIGTVSERRREFALIQASGNSGIGQWVRRTHVIAAVGAIDRELLTPGTHVGVIWNGQIWGAVVVETPEQGVVIRWDQGEQVQTVASDDVVAIW